MTYSVPFYAMQSALYKVLSKNSDIKWFDSGATIEEIAEQMHMSAEEAALVKSMLDNARLVSRAKAENEPEEDPEEEEKHVEDTALFQMRQRIADLLADLPEEDATLLTLRFGLEGGRPLTPEETGRKLNLTPEEVVTKEAAALMKLRGN